MYVCIAKIIVYIGVGTICGFINWGVLKVYLHKHKLGVDY
jgi:hypothetical protein